MFLCYLWGGIACSAIRVEALRMFQGFGEPQMTRGRSSPGQNLLHTEQDGTANDPFQLRAELIVRFAPAKFC